MWLKSGFVYPAAMPGQREEVVSINAPENDKCDVVKAAVDIWLKQKPREKLKRATTSQPKVSLESSELHVSEAETE